MEERRNENIKLIETVSSLKEQMAREAIIMVEKLGSINTQLALVNSSILSERGNVNRLVDGIYEKLDETKKAVQIIDTKINDEDGLIIRVKALEEIEKNRAWQLKAFWIALMGIFLKYIFEIWQTITKKINM